jgi:hypothetical protein
MRSARPIDRLVSANAATEAALKTCSLACKAVVAHFLSEAEAEQSEFGRCLLRAAAAIDAAADALDADPNERSATFAIAAPICRAAMDRCRHAGFDPLVFKAAAACERAATICEGHL